MIYSIDLRKRVIAFIERGGKKLEASRRFNVCRPRIAKWLLLKKETGTCYTELFNLWVETILLPALKPGQVVILDNVTFHKSEKTKALIENANCALLFLPPYSPDFDPIETIWANLKAKIRHFLKYCFSLSDAIEHAFSM